jgi:serine/threonine protein kinase
VKILDFGIARAAGRDPGEFDTSVLGGLTPAYASSEMALGAEPDVRDDVFGLACVAYELLAGRHPFERKPASIAKEQGLAPRPIPGLSNPRMRALERGLAFAREDRTPSVVEFLAELEQKPEPRTPWTHIAAAGLGVAVAATAVVYWYTSSQQCSIVDDEFLDALRAQATPLERVDASYRGVLLEQGDEYLAEAATDFDPTLLSEGVTNAFGAFTTVLRIDPNSAEAGAGIMRIIDAYRVRADQLLAQGDARSAITVADYGLKVHPRHCALNSLKTRAVALLE